MERKMSFTRTHRISFILSLSAALMIMIFVALGGAQFLTKGLLLITVAGFSGALIAKRLQKSVLAGEIAGFNSDLPGPEDDGQQVVVPATIGLATAIVLLYALPDHVLEPVMLFLVSGLAGLLLSLSIWTWNIEAKTEDLSFRGRQRRERGFQPRF